MGGSSDDDGGPGCAGADAAARSSIERMTNVPSDASSRRAVNRRRRSTLALVLLSPIAATAQHRRSVRLTVLSNGVLIADGSLTTVRDLDLILAKLREEQGVVWYYRENSRGEPPPTAVEALKLVVKHGLPLSFFSDPDYRDEVVVDGNAGK